MLSIILKKQKERKYLIINVISFIAFMVIYLLLDHLNLSYQEMIVKYGIFLPIVNIVLNIIMSLISALMMGLSASLLNLTGKDGKGSSLSFISIIFGMLTYGCTPGIIAFFASIGITFTVAILPLAGLPYKFISLILVIIGFIWLLWQIKNVKCKVPS